jgi:YegS/Rv2252/BmrU family lipid kinase
VYDNPLIKDKLKARVIVNPISGRGRHPQDDISDLNRIFSEHGIESQVICQAKRGEATLLAREAVAEGFDTVVAVGGDGTINEVVCGLVNSGVPLGIVPAGSGNGLAREFGISLKLREACETIIHGDTREVDVGIMNDRFFLGTAGIGYDALLVQIFEERWANRRGVLPYFYVAIKGFFKHKPSSMHLRFNNRQLTVVPKLVTVANTTQFGGRAIIAPQAKPDDGLLDVCIIHNLSFLKAFYHWPKLFMGCIDRMPQWVCYRTAAVEILSDLPMPVQVDGESVQESSHLKIRLLPRALGIRVPKGTYN